MNHFPFVAAVILTLAVAGCDTPTGEVRSITAKPPVPPYGLIVGVVALARTENIPPFAMRLSGTRLKFRHASGDSGDLLLAPREGMLWKPLDVRTEIEDGLPVTLRPFALQLPAGQVDFYQLAADTEESESRTVFRPPRKGEQTSTPTTVTRHYEVITAADVPIATVEVAPGSVRYVGRVGAFFHARPNFSGPGVCVPRQPYDLKDIPGCVGRQLFIGNAPDTDLAIIRQRYPNLATVPIEVQPLVVPPGSWLTLSKAHRSLVASP